MNGDAPHTEANGVGLLEGLHARPPAGMKHCPACTRMRSVEDFWKDKASKDGLFAYCKQCANLKKANMPVAPIDDASMRAIVDAPAVEKVSASVPAKLQHKVFMVLEDACGLSRAERGALVRMLAAYDAGVAGE